jgi:hypothetical protein
VREEERHADGGLVPGGKPLIGEEAHGLELESLRFEFAVELPNPPLDIRAVDAHAEIADAEMEEVVIGELLPRDLGLAAGQGALLAPERSSTGGPGC